MSLDALDGPVGIANQDYAKQVKNLIKLITDLRAMGAQSHIDLPRITVIGNQSAGKSSVVEAISGITVPRSSGTCTRCPMECRLTCSPQPWRAQVLLRFERDEAGNRLPEVKEEKFGPPIVAKSELELQLKRAQLAILNPSVASELFVELDLSVLTSGCPPLGSDRQLQFSPNVVCLDISGPELTDLSFIDLPGIISNVAEGEDRGNIDLIKNLVKDHIAGNALILLTITMRDDLENQSAAFLAKEADPNGLRTIGVLTKPDTLQEGEEPAWLKVLSGESHPLRHGYYVTKQPNISELEQKLDHGEARQREKEYFASQAPWKSAPPMIRNRIGVPNLTRELSRLLSQLIEKLLPQLRSNAKSSLSGVMMSLNGLPQPPSENPTAHLLQLVTSFTSLVDRYIQGGEGHEDLLRDCRPAYQKFQKDVSQTEPKFCPSERQVTSAAIDSDSSSPTDQVPMYLDDVRKYVDKALGRHLPFNVPFSAKIGLIRGCFADWSTHARSCFATVYKVSEAHVNKLITLKFERFARGGLLDHVRTIVESQFETARESTLKRLDWFMAIESTPFTLNDHYFSSYRQKYLAMYKEERQSATGRFSMDVDSVREAMASLARLGFSNLANEDLNRLLGADPFEQEMICMSEVRAYFQVAYKRIIDNVPRAIDYDFLGSLKEEPLREVLTTKLGLASEIATQRASAYLSEDPNVAAEREELLQKKASLEEIIDRLFNFML
ncbi:hypothetical protein BD410DRAFT_717419 [Rickenella mellea]|uniref:P-loop containing nucleoside triphosphate hydrolase protein n=1 Tax=Rickenella mellea TaxID=50990 RepID=A0A4Y7QCY6_9AGAM|nr:hypothetical protein BD410DRAFT_717419 [Rickenella mellea]